MNKERAAILQCLRYIVVNNFLQPKLEPNSNTNPSAMDGPGPTNLNVQSDMTVEASVNQGEGLNHREVDEQGDLIPQEVEGGSLDHQEEHKPQDEFDDDEALDNYCDDELDDYEPEDDGPPEELPIVRDQKQ